MKYSLSTILLLIGFNLYSQNQIVDTSYYPNNRIYTIDSLYPGDSIRLQKLFYADIDYVESGTIYLGNRDWEQLEREGEYILIRDKSWIQYGIWRYWYKNGNLRSETYSPNDDYGTRYINQWSPGGKQYLASGEGVFYQIGAERITENGLDSTVYEIKDSLKNGTYVTWCPYGSEQFYKCEVGQFIDNMKQPMRIQYYQNGTIKVISSFVNNHFTGEYQRFHENGIYAQYGHYNNNGKIGVWKYWNEDGVLIKEVNYKNNRFNGKIREYHPNGLLQKSGQYVFTSGKDTVWQIDPMTLEHVMKVSYSDEISVKNGEWVYYNSSGALVKRELYKDGVLLKNGAQQ